MGEPPCPPGVIYFFYFEGSPNSVGRLFYSSLTFTPLILAIKHTKSSGVAKEKFGMESYISDRRFTKEDIQIV